MNNKANQVMKEEEKVFIFLLVLYFCPPLRYASLTAVLKLLLIADMPELDSELSFGWHLFVSKMVIKPGPSASPWASSMGSMQTWVPVYPVCR